MPKAKGDNSNSGKVKVVCRFRPMNSFEASHGGSLYIKIVNSKNVDIRQTSNANDSKYYFSFDRAFGHEESQRTVYEEAAKPVVESVLDGYNGTIMAYGQTASGKTYTMQGQNRCDSNLRGIIPRMVETVFEYIKESPENIEFMVKLSIIEIYMEELRDLLINDERKKLKIRSGGEKGIFVENLTEVYVTSAKEVYSYMKTGNRNRSVGRTNMNIVSSRSHLMFSLTLHQTDTKNHEVKTGKLLLVDLAGSEKVSKSGSDGKSLEEAKNINKSLLSLGQVIYSLNEESHVPYRDSKLTRLLQQSLGGNSKTTLIMCCTPGEYNEQETLSTLRFGTRAQEIQNSPVLNRQYTNEQLKLMLGKIQKEKRNLEDRVSLLEEFIMDKIPNYSNLDLEQFQQHRLKLVKTSSRVTKASTNFPSNLNSPRQKEGLGVIKRTFEMDNEDIRLLRKEVLEFKQKAQSLQFENEKLQKLLSESKVETSPPSSIDIESRLSRRTELTVDKENIGYDFTDLLSPRRAKGLFKEVFKIEEYNCKIVEDFEHEVKQLDIQPLAKANMKVLFMRQEEKNMMQHSKLSDLKNLIEGMIEQFRAHVNKDYQELQNVHRDMMIKSGRETGGNKKNRMSKKDLLNLLSVYHSENTILKKQVGSLQEVLTEKEEKLKDEKRKLSNRAIDQEAKMEKLHKILRKFLSGTKKSQGKGSLLSSLAQKKIIPQRKPTFNWGPFSTSAGRSEATLEKKKRYDLLNALTSKSAQRSIVKKLTDRKGTEE